MFVGLGMPLFRGANVSLLALYAVLGTRPELVLDFDDEKYFANSTQTTFSNAITHSASTNATMVDSDGLLKWRPHNLLLRSEEFDNAAWENISGGTASAPVVTANAGVAPDGTTTADRIQCDLNGGATATDYSLLRQDPTFPDIAEGDAVYSVWLKSNTGLDQNITLSYANVPASVVTVTSEWELFSVTPNKGGGSVHECDIGLRGNETDDTCDVLVWGAHLYRSSLGGMVNNPDRGDSYVPTTSSAVYLPRRGHHVYNGTAWVNEGLLHESEQRVNLSTTSNTISGYTTAGVSLSSGAATSPSGLTDASQATSDGGSSAHGFGTLAMNFVSDTTYVNSFFLKAGTEDWVQITAPSALSSDIWANFNLADGTVGNKGSSVADTFVEPYGNGWYRCSISYIAPTSTSSLGTVVYMLNGTDASSRAPTFTNSGRTIFFYQEDINAAATPSSPIPTSGSTVTRAAETLTVPSAKLPWPTPVYIGPELVTNGDFATGDLTGWSVGGTDGTHYVEYSSGGARYVSDTTSPVLFLSQTGILTIGKVYEISVTTTAYTSGSLKTDSFSGTSVLSNGLGTITVVGVASSTSFIIVRNSSNVDVTIDNISVREIDPLAVSIQMQGRVTSYDRDFSANVVLARWFDTNSDRIEFWLQSNGSRNNDFAAVQWDNNVLAASGQNTGTGSGFGQNVPFNVAARHGSTFTQGAIDGTALDGQGWEYGDTTPTALPDLSATDLNLGYDYMGTIKLFRIWADDLGDTGIEDATLPSLEPSLSLIFDGSESSFTVSDWSE